MARARWTSSRPSRGPMAHATDLSAMLVGTRVLRTRRATRTGRTRCEQQRGFSPPLGAGEHMFPRDFHSRVTFHIYFPGTGAGQGLGEPRAGRGPFDEGDGRFRGLRIPVRPISLSVPFCDAHEVAVWSVMALAPHPSRTRRVTSMPASKSRWQACVRTFAIEVAARGHR